MFLVIEGWIAKAPLMPLRLFRSRQLSAANLIIALVGASTFAMWFFLSLYLQEVLGYSPIKTGLVFLPMTLAIVVGSTIASRITMRVGPKRLLVVGMAALTVGLAWFTRHRRPRRLPRRDAGAGPARLVRRCRSPSSRHDLRDVRRQAEEAGLASAVANTARLFGGALGLAILATLATSHSTRLLHHPTAAVHTANQALVSGFQLAFWVAGRHRRGGCRWWRCSACRGPPARRRGQSEAPRRAVATEIVGEQCAPWRASS